MSTDALDLTHYPNREYVTKAGVPGLILADGTPSGTPAGAGPVQMVEVAPEAIVVPTENAPAPDPAAGDIAEPTKAKARAKEGQS